MGIVGEFMRSKANDAGMFGRVSRLQRYGENLIALRIQKGSGSRRLTDATKYWRVDRRKTGFVPTLYREPFQ